MSKAKKQLRAEAVERLKNTRHHTLADYVRAMLGWGHEPHFEDCRDALIDLLTDDCDTECYICSKLAELIAENNALRVKCDEHDEAERDWERKFNEAMGTEYEMRQQIVKELDELRAGEWAKANKREEVLDLQQDLLNDCDGEESRVITSHNELFEMMEERTPLHMVAGEDGSVEPDSREKLEADILRRSTKKCDFLADRFNTVHVSVEIICDWLDRQAAITERELCRRCYWPSLAAQPDQEAYDRIDELEAENAKLRGKVKRQAEQLAEVQDALRERNEAAKPKWEKQLKKAQKESAELQSSYDALVGKCAELCAMCGFTMVDASGEAIG